MHFKMSQTQNRQTMNLQISKNLMAIDATIKDVMATLDRSPIGIVFFVGHQNKLEGIMTDGDVRRTILKGVDINVPASHFIVRDFVYGKINSPHKENVQLMNKRIRHLPILDEQGQLIDFLSIPGLNRLPVMEPLLGGNELSYVVDCINTNWISSQGKYVFEFEKQFASYHDDLFALNDFQRDHCSASGFDSVGHRSRR
jgi:perosamine synthetase